MTSRTCIMQTNKKRFAGSQSKECRTRWHNIKTCITNIFIHKKCNKIKQTMWNNSNRRMTFSICRTPAHGTSCEMETIAYTSAFMTTLSPPLLTAAELDTSSGWMHFHSPYVRPTVFCQRRRVPSSLPLAYSSPSGEKRTQCTGPKWPLNDSAHETV